MKRIGSSQIKAVVFGIILLLVICGLISLIISLVNSSGFFQSNSSSTSSSVSSDETTKTKQITADHKLVGIRKDDTLAVLKDNGDEVVINLAHYKWHDPLWSTDGKLVSVLGQSNVRKTISDIYLYDLSLDKWKAVTTFVTSATTGVTGSAWIGTTTLAFTQGTDPNNWLHEYDYVNNEITKIFRAPGTLESFSTTAQRYLFSKNVGTDASPDYRITITDIQGNEVRAFTAGDFLSGARLISARWGKGQQDLVFNLYLQGVTKQYVWTADSDIIQVVDASPAVEVVCYLDGDNYLTHYSDGNSKELRFTEFDLSLARPTAEWGMINKSTNATFWQSNSSCSTDHAYVSVINQELGIQNIIWYIVSANSPKLFQAADGYTQLSHRD